MGPAGSPHRPTSAGLVESALTGGPGWIAICEAAGLTRSMSRKGRNCDNARAEGFSGLSWQEFFRGRDWTGVGAGEFSAALDEWVRWFRSGRISQALGWLTSGEHRLVLGYAVQVQENVRSPLWQVLRRMNLLRHIGGLSPRISNSVPPVWIEGMTHALRGYELLPYP